MNAEAERYLRRATRGLWGRRRREVREELAAHLGERVTAYRIAGLSEHDATDRALTELGSPRVVSAGMARLYTLPTVMGSSLAAAVLGLSVLALWPKGLAQSAVIGSFYWPSPTCTAALRTDSVLGAYKVCQELDNNLWLDPQAFTKTLEAQGVTVQRGNDVLTLTLPDTSPLRVPLGGPLLLFSELGENAGEAEEIPAVLGAVSLWDVLRTVSRSELPLQLEGWDNPVVHIGAASFQIGTKLRSVSGERVYESYLENVFMKDLSAPIQGVDSLLYFSPRTDPNAPLEEVTLELTAPPGTYGIVTMLDPATLQQYELPTAEDDLTGFDLYLSFEVVRFEGATFTANLPAKPVRFVEAFGAEPEPGTAMLVRLGSGENWFEVVSPEDVTLEARP